MERTLIAPGVHLMTDPAEKFNRCRISVHFAFPAKRATATAHALLPLVLERGYADCPDMTELTKTLARLYGADLTVDGRAQGSNRNLCISITGIKDRFALEGEALTREYAKIVLGVAFHPYLVDGAFDPEAVEIEKTMLKKALEDEINDKRLYCSWQAMRLYYGAAGEEGPAIRQRGYLEEVPGLTPAAVTAAYREMLRTAQIELIVMGCGAETGAVKAALLAELAVVDRAPVPLAGSTCVPRQPVVHAAETFDTVQAKLCMVFTQNRLTDLRQMAAYRLAMAVYGGSVTSRLFLQVREKLNLCYYCSSAFQSFTGTMVVNSGVEPDNARRAEEAILHQLADLCEGEMTAEELEDSRTGLLAGMQGIEDSLGGIESWYYLQVLRGEPLQTPQASRAALAAVTADEVRQVLRQFTLSVSYLVTPRKEGWQ